MADVTSKGNAPRGLAVLGSTGSIGTSTLELVRGNPDRFRVVTLAAGNNIDLLAAQVEEFRPDFVSVHTGEAAERLRPMVGSGCEVGVGIDAACRAARYEGVETVVAAISGAAGLKPTMAAIEAGRDVALANKETLVLAGPLVMEEARKRGVNILPVDSEHSAVFQSLVGHRREDVERIILTASGGPFLDTPSAELESVTPDAALRHPKWSMGRKITIDSATLMNKGLEVIEARWFFDIPPEKISVVIHPQSVVHSLVEYVDGSVVSQLGTPDMKGPISYALSYPARLPGAAPRLKLAGTTLEFREPDLERFPCLGLAYRALETGGLAPAVLNAADEIAVGAFLDGHIPFAGIPRVISAVLDATGELDTVPEDIDEVLEADARAREAAVDALTRVGRV